MNGQAASYDFENHLVSLANPANNTVLASYTYDADGNRCSTYVSSNNPTTTSYVVDTSLPYASVVEEYVGSSTTPSARYDYGDDLVRMDRGSGVYYYLYDGLGSTRQLVSTAGAVTDTWGYSAFGELASHTGTTANPFLFNAQQFDGASGDYYLRARYYDQSNGRFISQDPYSGDDEDPLTLHRYLYSGNDPVNCMDPGGQDFSAGEALCVIGIGTILLTAGCSSDSSAKKHSLNTVNAIYGSHGPSGAEFWQAYSQVDYQKFPTAANRPQVAGIVGGNVGEFVSNQENCATRLSYALGQSGWEIPQSSEFQTNFNSPSVRYMGKPGDGHRYILGAKHMRQYLRQAWGPPDIANYPAAGRDPSSNAFLQGLFLHDDGVAVFATDGHVGVIKPGYKDIYVSGQGVIDVWKLPQ